MIRASLLSLEKEGAEQRQGRALTVVGNTWTTTHLKFCTYTVVSPFSSVPGEKKELDFGLLWTLECLCRLYQVNTPNRWVQNP